MILNTIIPIEVRTAGASDFVPTITSYLPENGDTKKPALLIFAGGAYKTVCQYEAAPTARKYADHGFAVFNISYSCLPAVFPQSLCEGLWAVRYIRSHAEEFGIDPENVNVMGFSAGGHVVAAMGTLWRHPMLDEYLGKERADCRPDKMILCYPVLSNEGEYHQASFFNLLGPKGFSDPALMELTCLEKQVGDDTPPTFLWHGCADRDVPVSGSFRFVEALQAHHVPTEAHFYPFATHGGGLNRNAYHGDWSDKAEIFMRDERLKAGKPN